jgi:arylsulfatase
MTERRPNIILVMTDQQRHDTIAALGHPFMETPTLDRLVREGTAFTRCYINAASCVPARASLFTGYHPHTTGILTNGCSWRHSWVELLARAGYFCVNLGKMHFQPFDAPGGFHIRHTVENKERRTKQVGRYYFDEWDRALAAHGLARPDYRAWPDFEDRLGAYEWPLPAALHSDNFTGDFCSWWIRNYEKTEPLFLQIGFPGPHPPYDPTAAIGARYLAKDLPLDEIGDDDLNSQPPAFVALRERHVERQADSVAHQVKPSQAARHRQRAYYLANVTMIDHKIGQILESLNDQGYLDDAVVIFMSDHGDCLTDHGHSQKWNNYEQTVRVPLIVWAPGRVAADRRVDELVQLFDLGPTILDYAGVPVPASFEASSLKPALDGEPFAGRPFVCCEQGRDANQNRAELITMLRTEDWKLVHFLGEPDGQLFDLRADPGERVNLWHDPAHDATRQDLLQRLYLWRMQSAHHTRDWAASHR